jgi:hypothetical protein
MTLLIRGIALLVLLLAPVASAQGQSKWIVYAPKKLGFRIELPAQPAVTGAEIKTTDGPARARYFFFKGENELHGRMEVRHYEPGRISTHPDANLKRPRKDWDRISPLR